MLKDQELEELAVAFPFSPGVRERMAHYPALMRRVQDRCRAAIRQAQSMCRLAGRTVPPDENSPYCQSRGPIPLEVLRQIHQGSVTTRLDQVK